MATNPVEQTARILWDPTEKSGPLSASRRTGIACAFCRARKVKCNRLDEQPCTNCVFENVQCMLLPKQRRNRKAKSSVKARFTRPELHMDAMQSAPALNTEQTNSAEAHVLSVLSQANGNMQAPEPESTPDATALGEDDTPSNQAVDESHDDMDWREAAVEAMPERPLYSSNSPTTSTNAAFQAPSLPHFLKSPAPSLTDQDIEYLARKGALDVPNPELRDALIESYLLFIHPCYPILDLDVLAEAVRDGSTQKFSLPVFQAVMFAASSWVDVKLLRKLGYLSRWAARKALYSKVRLLYDADYEEDQMCQLQVLVLLSLWWKGPNEAKDGWHWLGLAISLARTMGLHQDSAGKHLDAKTRALRRRIWWSCAMRDTFASFSSNRVPRILDRDFAVSPLTLSDFEHGTEHDTNQSKLLMQSPEVRKQLATICIQTAAVCRIITRVLLAAYQETSTGNIDILYTSSTPKEVKPDIEPTRLQRIDDEFRDWQNSTPKEALHLEHFIAPASRIEQATLVHRALLSTLYHTGLILLHRQRKIGSLSMSCDGSRELVRNHATQANKIVMDMYIADLMKDMPPTVISLLFPVSMSHILDMKSRDATLREQGRQRLEECKQVLRELSDGQLAAEWAVNFLVKAQLHVMKSSSNPVETRTLSSNSERRFSRVSNSAGVEHRSTPHASNSDNAGLLSSSSAAPPSSHMQPAQLTFVPTLSDLTGADDPFNWDYFESQWNLVDIDQFENTDMPMQSGQFNLSPLA